MSTPDPIEAAVDRLYLVRPAERHSAVRAELLAAERRGYARGHKLGGDDIRYEVAEAEARGRQAGMLEAAGIAEQVGIDWYPPEDGRAADRAADTIRAAAERHP